MSLPIILASQSPRRKQLLEWAEIAFDVVIKSTDESYPATLPTIGVPVHIARQKALAVREYIKIGYHAQHQQQIIAIFGNRMDFIALGKRKFNHCSSPVNNDNRT